MNAIVRLFWYSSITIACLTLLLSYAYLPNSIQLMSGFEFVGKSYFFNIFLVSLGLMFFITRIFQYGIRKQDWAFLFPFAKKWKQTPVKRDLYREHIETWIIGTFAIFNYISVFIMMIIWGINDNAVFTYQNIYIIVLLVISIILVLTITIPPFLILKGPSLENGSES